VQALRRGLLQGALSSERAAEALANYLALPLTRHGHLLLLGRALQLRANFSAYDASYIALAERLGTPLLTADGRLARAARQHTDVEVIAV
jgi:predicted nucleic acid-binding protein